MKEFKRGAPFGLGLGLIINAITPTSGDALMCWLGIILIWFAFMEWK